MIKLRFNIDKLVKILERNDIERVVSGTLGEFTGLDIYCTTVHGNLDRRIWRSDTLKKEFDGIIQP